MLHFQVFNVYLEKFGVSGAGLEYVWKQNECRQHVLSMALCRAAQMLSGLPPLQDFRFDPVDLMNFTSLL